MNKKIVAASVICLTASMLISSSAGFIDRNVHAEEQNKGVVDQPTVAEATETSSITFKDIPATHWAAASIQGGIDKGYVAGYPDLTFQPNKAVSRAEFLKMGVVALAFETEKPKPNTYWYQVFVNAAIQQAIIGEKEYADGNYNASMTRQEMARVAVKATGKSAVSDKEYMLVAAQEGLIHGTGNGQLNVHGTTTRAQSVTIIERIIKVRAGEKLPTDPGAIKSAEEAMKVNLDPWGYEIRTTNLPKNAADYPYILKDIPNEAYEMKYSEFAKMEPTPAIKVTNYSGFTKEEVDKMVSNVENYFSHVLNINYKTIDYKWAEKLLTLVDRGGASDSGMKNRLKKLKAYVDWVKENKVLTEGEFKPIPSMTHKVGYYVVRGYFEFKIVSATKSAFDWEDTLPNWTIFWAHIWNMKFTINGVGKTFKGYTDIDVMPEMTRGIWSTFKPMPGADISSNFILIK